MFRSGIHVIVGFMNLSVVIPAYNEEKYLTGTLEAVRLALALIPEAEIIVVDNESTNARDSKCAGCEDRR